MNETVTSLQAKLDELKKRLKEISTTQSNYIALKQIKEYFAVVQEYLNTINKNYSSHIEECSSHTTQIDDIYSQISQINTKIDNLPSLEDIDFTEVNSEISTLKTDLQTLSEKFNTLTEDSDTSISQIVSDISLIETELASLQNYISTHEQEFTEVNTSIGNMQTNIDNLTTAQNNLTSTQNNLTTNVNNINTRLTSVEQEVSAITGGVDLTELNERVEILEEIPPTFNLIESVTVPINQTFDTISHRTIKDLAFSCYNNGFAMAKLKLKFTHISSTYSSNFQFYINNEFIKDVDVYPTENPSSYEESIVFECNTCCVPISVKVHSTSGIFIESLTVELFANNVKQLNYDQEYQPFCFNNEIYLTRKTDTSYQFGKFTIDKFSLTDLPFEIANDNIYEFYRLFYMPISTGTEGTFGETRDSIIIHKTNGDVQEYTNIDETMENLIKQNSFANPYPYCNYAPTYLKTVSLMFSQNLEPVFFQPFGDGVLKKFSNLSKYKSGGWSYITNIINNYLTSESNYLTDSEIQALCLNEDGNFYFFPQKSLKYVVKIGKGQSATAYLQQDGTINVYISNCNKIYKYNIAKDENNKYYSTFVKAITGNVLYELFNNYVLLKINKNWYFMTLT